MKEFLKKNFIVIVSVFLLLVFFNTCSQTRKINALTSEITALRDSTYTKDEFNVKLDYIILNNEIEGLKSEKRMIQSTDRKLWDLKRGAEIDKELDLLNKKKYEILGK